MLKIEPAIAIFAGEKIIAMIESDARDLYEELHKIYGKVSTPDGEVTSVPETTDAPPDAAALQAVPVPCLNCQALESQVRNLQRNLAAADTENSQLHEQNQRLREDLKRREVS